MSYATNDSKRYNVKELARRLEKFRDIESVLMWEKDTKEDIIDYMNDNIEKCDIFVLFCSENSSKSKPVRLEWKAALSINKKIIPIFDDEKNIPTLLRSKLGLKFEGTIYDITQKLHQLIIKRTSSDEDSQNSDLMNQGYCIRCGERIPLNNDDPYCYNCFQVWDLYQNFDYSEEFCHKCGVRFSTSMRKPLCDNCYYG